MHLTDLQIDYRCHFLVESEKMFNIESVHLCNLLFMCERFITIANVDTSVLISENRARLQ